MWSILVRKQNYRVPFINFYPGLIDRVGFSQINLYKHCESWVDERNCVKALFGRRNSALVLSFPPVVS